VELDDELLVKKCLEGDGKCFQYLVSRYQRKLFAVAFGMVHQVEDALDLVQETLIKGYNNLPRFQGDSSFYTWLYRILTNLCIDFLRREKRHYTESYDDTSASDENNIGANWLYPNPCTSNPLHSMSNRELGQQIQAALDKLSPNHRMIIVLREIEGMSYEHIAETMGCNKGTVMSRLHHARAKLRQELSEYVEEFDIAKTESDDHLKIPVLTDHSH
jgi:RNA polymerase sigma-70 factor (ECF subfamily)